MTIFRGNDVRGVYGTELTDEKATLIGGAFVRFLKCDTVVVGRDSRISSPALSKAIIKGLRRAGANVIDIGVIDSPGLYFASHHLQKPAIMVTASHNPPEHNGFYLCKTDAQPIYRENGLLTIEKFANESYVGKQGKYRRMNIWPAYERHVLSFLNFASVKPLKIVIDVGNGAGGAIATRIFRKIPAITIIPLNFKPDGRFPNRGPDTSDPSNLRELQKKVRTVKADMGCAFDGDADRVAFVDENGKIIEGSITGALLAGELLSNKKETILYSIRCSRIVPELIERRHSIAIRERVGHSFMATHMREHHALFAIENTGHYFYRDNFYTESAIITSLIMIALLSSSRKNLSELVNPLVKYYMTEEISLAASNPKQALTLIEKTLQKKYRRPIDSFDGLSVDCGSYWLSVRASQTESKIRMVVEGRDRKEAEMRKKELYNLVKKTVR